MDLNIIGKSVIELVKEVGSFIKTEGKAFNRSVVEAKGTNDFVSFVDKQSEQKLVKGLSEILPGSGFIAEEGTAGSNGEEYLWIIDPLDGTTNFIHGVAPHSVSIALQKNNRTIFGVVYELGRNELFYSWEGIGVFCDENEIKVSTAQSMSDALICAGMPVNDFSRLTGHLQVVHKVVTSSHGLRRTGSAATDLAYVAAGRFCGFFEYGLSAWDVAAGIYLVERAGGKVGDYSGGNNYLFGREMLAATPGVYNDLLLLLKENM